VVGQTAGTQDLVVLDGLAALLDQSLLRQLDQDGSAPRFGMLETIREYAWEQLERSGEADLVRCRHACYFLVLAETLGEQLDKPGDQSWTVTRLLAEFDNFRAVMAWSTQAPSPDSDIPSCAG
jgi:predicted ATPase